MLRRFLRRWVFSRPLVCFIVMGFAFLVFGLGSVNLVHLMMANLNLVSAHGWQALVDGALIQLFELLLSGYGSLLAYVVFKSCEHSLVEVLTAAQAHSAPDQSLKPKPSDSMPV